MKDAINLFEKLTTVDNPAVLVTIVSLAALAVIGMAMYAVIQAIKRGR